MASDLEIYLKSSHCGMNECPYGLDISCNDCINRMIEEHDIHIINEAINHANGRYMRGVWDFYKLLVTTDNTPKEIFNRLIDDI